tara:strand:- start:484 stop:903 length:420 start_codon:yes stop_codon:yes gene_type:complete
MPLLTKQYKFCSAHRYWNDTLSDEDNYKNFGKDIYLHGHNYMLDITLKGPINPKTGFIIDLQKLNIIVDDYVINIFDHKQIEKDIKWFHDKQPSTENMVVFIWEQLYSKIDKPARLYSIKLQETPTISTKYFGPGENNE